MELEGSGGRLSPGGNSQIGIWGHKIAEMGLAASKRLVCDTGLRVSSVCRGGMFPTASVSDVKRG